eukprot:EG_transcript_4731
MAPHAGGRWYRASRALLDLPSQRYQQLVQQGDVAEDPCQRTALAKLDAVYQQLEAFKAATPPPAAAAPAPTGFFSSLFGTGKASPQPEASSSKQALSKIQGLYMHGGVGCGKSFLMDLFFNELAGVKKKRVHFHEFMLGVHQGIHRYKRQDRTTDGITQVVQDLVDETDVLCFDEVQVTDIADAMILRRLFSAMYASGLVVVATSNRAPGELYKGGLNREVFVPFIKLLKDQCIVHDMAAETDYRTTGDKMRSCYFTPLNQASAAKMRHAWKRFSPGPDGTRELTVFGRAVKANKASGRMAWFSFAELCSAALSAADYQALSREFHTLFLEGVPHLDMNLKAEIRRLILLVDELYEHKVKLFVSAAAEPGQLLVGSSTAQGNESNYGEFVDALGALGAHADMFNGQEERFAFSRCISRLQEMQSRQYLALNHTVLGRPEYVDRLLEMETPTEPAEVYVPLSKVHIVQPDTRQRKVARRS